MDIKVLFSRGDGVYVIGLDDGFYLVNLKSGTISERKEYIDSFLKFGCFYPLDKIEESVQKGLFMCEVNLNKDLFQNFNMYKKVEENYPYIKTMLEVIKAEFEKNKFNCEWAYYSTGWAKFTLTWGIN